MANEYLITRLEGIQAALNAVHKSSSSMSSASRGQERQAFIHEFLENVFPPVYRFGTGDATDSAGKRSGQLDVVVEQPLAPSLPAVSGGKNPTRLYLAESIAAVLEVKSDASAQWGEAVRTAEALGKLKRKFETMMVSGYYPGQSIPLFVIGYTGWKNAETVQHHLEQCPHISGVLIIEGGLFVSSPHAGAVIGTGPLALWGFISILHTIVSGITDATLDLLAYGRNSPPP
jgi:hypothetical protein